MSSFKELEGTLNEKFSPFPRFALEVVLLLFSFVEYQSQPNIIPNILYPITFSPPGPPYLPHLCQWQAKVETLFFILILTN